MKQVEERYISLLTDFGFKRIFGSAPNKEALDTLDKKYRLLFWKTLYKPKKLDYDKPKIRNYHPIHD